MRSGKLLFSATKTIRKAYTRYDNELISCRTPFPVIFFDIKRRVFQQICPN